MSDRYLFRGKRKDNGEWVYGLPVKSVNGRVYMIHGAIEDAINTKNEVDFIYSEVIPETVGQKTDGSLYDGDIFCDVEYYGKSLVFWKNGGWKIKSLDRGQVVSFGSFLTDDNLKPIGNKYDNPELLEGA